MASHTKSNNKIAKKETTVSESFDIRPKATAVAVNAVVGNKPNPRFEAPEQKWEDIESIFQSCAEGIVQIGNQVNAALSQPLVKQYLEDPKEVNIAIEGLKKDLEDFTTRLLRIHEQHKNLSGLITTPNDHAKSLSIFQEYVLFNEQFKGVTLPTVLTIMDHIGNACNRILIDNRNKEAAQTSETIENTTEIKAD